MADDKPGDVQEFGKVILSLDNVLVPPEKSSTTPSLLDGLDYETEIDLRILGCELIQTSGILLKLPQVAMASGQVLFQRFYYSKSFVKHNMEVVAMACINLASKIEEAPRRIRDVINVFHNVKQVKTGRTIQPLILDQNYINLKNQVIKAERRILKELGFCVHVKHPHKIIVMYLQVLESERNQRLLQAAWNYMNDSFRTSVFCGYHPEVIACACIHLAARQLQIPLPNSPHWFLIFNVEEDDINSICLTLLKLYSRPKPNADALDKIVNDAKKVQLEAKMKSKGGLSAANTPNSTSRAGSPKNISPSPLLVNNKVKSESDRSDRSRDPRESVNAAQKRKHSRSPKNYSRNFHSSSRSRSHSMSPKRRHRSPPRKYKKDVRRSRSPEHYKSKHSRKSKRRHRSYSRSRSRSRSYSPGKASKKYYKEKVKHRSRSRDRYKAKKRSNGHRERSRSRERYRR